MKPPFHSLQNYFMKSIIITCLFLPTLFANSITTINISRTIIDWKNKGCECNDYSKSNWYVFNQKINPQIKNQLRLCGGSVLYIGNKDGYHLYHQGITVACDSIVSILKQDSHFINILPLIAEEKLSYQIYRDSGLYYIDSLHNIFKAQVEFSITPTNQLLESLKTCVDSIEVSGNNLWIYGTRQDMICVAQKSFIKFISDIAKDSPPTMDNSRIQTGVDTLHKTFLDISTTPPDTNWNNNRLYTGKGITIAVCEGGDIDSTNLDFNETRDGSLTNLRLRRVPGSSNWTSADHHKTHVAGTAAGSGWFSIYDTLFKQESYRFRGVAPKALLRSEGGITYQIADVNTHSDGSNQRWYYDQDRRLDSLIANHDTSAISGNNNIEIISAGNEGDNSRSWTGEAGYITLRRHSKNAIHVGSSQKYSGYRSWHSSMGPHRDGRIGPTILAPGGPFAELDRIHMEIDYIRIRSNAGVIKKEWNFNNTANGWVPGPMNNFSLDSTSTSLILNISHGGSIITDTIVPALYADSNDLFEIRYFADDRDLPLNHCDNCKGKRRIVNAAIHWHDTNFVTGGIPTNFYAWGFPYNVSFFAEVNGGWQDVSVPLGRINQSSGGTRAWPFGAVANDSIARLAIGFAGTSIISSSNLANMRIYKYIDSKGTSMAAPHVAGITALMLQKYNEKILIPRDNSSSRSFNIHQHPLWPSSIRGMLIQSAKDLIMADSTFPYEPNDPDLKTCPAVYGRGPDWATGYGLVQADRAVLYVDSTRYIEDTVADGVTITYAFYVPPNADTMRVTLAWDDPSPSILVGVDRPQAFENKLVNNLDLRLEKNSTTHFPWTLNHTIFNDTIPVDGVHNISATTILQNPAVRTRPDTMNNAEVVEVDAPQSGLWFVKIQGTNIRFDQDPSTPLIDDQHFSLIFDYPIIKDTATTNWRVSSSGVGDVRAIGHALALASPGDTVTVTAGSYTVTTPDSTNGAILIFRPGVSVNFDGFDAFIYVGTGGKIVGAENVTLSHKIFLYNTPTAREPQPADNVIGLFGNLCRAVIVSTPGQTTKVGPGIYSIWTISNEGLIGVRDADRSKSSIIRLYLPEAPVCAPEPPQPPSMQKLLIMNMRFEVSDENSLPNALVLFDSAEIEFRNCSFDNLDSNGVVTANMIGIGDTSHYRKGVTKFTDCLFRNFKTAVTAFACTTQAQSPYFTNTIFQQCSTDIAYPPGSTALCNFSANQINSITIGTQRYTGGTTINNLITATCGGLPKRNISLSNIALVDEGNSDFRPSPRSSLIDNGMDNEDIGADNIDMVYTFSRFLDATILFGTGDTIIMNSGVLTKNTLGVVAVLKQTNTLNLRPVNEIIITSNFIDRPSEIRLRLNNPSAVSELPSEYVVFDVKINGHVFTQMETADIPALGDSTVIQGTPDNVSPAPVANVTAAQVGSNVVVSWNLNAETDIRRYKVYRTPSATPNNPVQIASANRSMSSYTDAGRTLTGFIYNVIAYDSTGNQSYSYPGLPLKVEMKDNGISEVNITKPQIKVTNLSSEPIKGFKVRVWFSRQEFVGKEIIVDRYYFNPSAITTTKGVHPLNSNIVYVELGYPSTYQLNPGASTPADGIQFGVHYTNYYPGQWIKSNDWSSYGITGSFSVTQRVTVYDSAGILLAGNEPTVYSAPQPPVINVPDVFGFESCNGWSVSAGTTSSDNTNKTQGISSVNFSGGGYQEIISTDLPTTEITGEKSPIKMDFYVGTTQPNPYYVGTLQIYANCPSAGLTNIYIGQKDLTPLTRGSFTALSFTLPTNVLNAMKGTYTDFSFKMLLNTNSGSGPYKMDNMRF